MRYWPKLFLLATLLLAAAKWVSEAGSPGVMPPKVQTPPGYQIAEGQTTERPTVDRQATDSPGTAEIGAAAQSGTSYEFRPSEQIIADRGVDFPADI